METSKPEDESEQEPLEDVSTILKNEVQSICTRLANLGEESLFLSAKVADKKTTKFGSDTGLLFITRFDVTQKFYQFVEEIYSSKPSSSYKQEGDGNENSKLLSLVENGDRIQPYQHKTDDANSSENNTEKSYGIDIKPNQVSYNIHASCENNQNNLSNVATENMVLNQELVNVESNSKLKQDIPDNLPTVMSSSHIGAINDKPVQQVAEIDYVPQQTGLETQEGSQYNQLVNTTQENSAILSKTNTVDDIQTLSTNVINNDSQLPLQYLQNIPPYLPISVGNPALSGLSVDHNNLIPNQSFIPQYGLTSQLLPPIVNDPIVSSADMEKIDPAGIVNQALVQSGIHENVAQAQLESNHQTGINLENTATKLPLPEGLDILHSDDTNKYHFFLEALRYLNPDLYPRQDFNEIGNQRNEGISMPYFEGDALQYSDAQHIALQNQSIQGNFSELDNQNLANSFGQSVSTEHSVTKVSTDNSKPDSVIPQLEKKKKKKKRKKKDGNTLNKSADDVKVVENDVPRIITEAPLAKRQNKGKLYKCDICEQYVASHRDIALHKVMHRGKVPPKCTICNNRFTTKRGLKHHMLKHQKPTSSFSCTACGKSFSGEDEYLKHAQEHETLQTQCSAQGNIRIPSDLHQSSEGTVNLLPQRNTHELQMHENLALQLTQIQQNEQLLSPSAHVPVGNVMHTMNSNNNVTLHPVVLDPKNPTNVLVSENQHIANVSTGNNLEVVTSNVEHHQAGIINMRQNPQTICNGDQSNHSSENLHASSVNRQNSSGSVELLDSSNSSGVISKTGEKIDLLKMSNAADIVLSGSDGTKGTCKVCSEEIASFEQTIVHFTIHKEQQSINESKQKREKVKERAKKQQTRHRKGRKYPCEACGQQFLHFNDLCLHRIGHKGKSPEKCQICDKGFTSKRGVRLHMELHKKDTKPYQCNICNLEIAGAQDFVEHKQSHGNPVDDSSSFVDSTCYSESDISSSNSLQLQHSSEKAINQNHIHQQMSERISGENSEIQQTLNDIQTLIHYNATQVQENYPPNYGIDFNNQKNQNLQQCNVYANPLPSMQHNIDPLQVAQMNLLFQNLNKQVITNLPTSTLQQENLPVTQHKMPTLSLSVDSVGAESSTNENGTQSSIQKSNLKKGKRPKIAKVKHGKYSCDECEKQFRMFHDLRLHKITHRGKSPQLCTVCNKLFVSKKGLRDHMNLHKKNVPKNICDICGKEFLDLNQLILHKLEHVEEAREKIADKRDKIEPSADMGNVENDKSPIVVEDLEESLEKESIGNSSTTIKSDVVNQELETVNNCQIENVNCREPVKEILDSENVSQKPAVECINKDNENRLLEECNTKKNTDESCEKEKVKDSKLTSELSCLIDHVSNDSMNDEHECPFCRERFSGPESLKQHLYIHMEDSDTPGEEQNDDSMIEERKENEGLTKICENVHVCNICGERFSGVEAFDFHKKKHKPLQKYKCKVCHEQFSELNEFRSHKKVKGHVTSRFKCELCGKLFNKEENFRKHKLKNHKKYSPEKARTVNFSKNLLTCSVCGKYFTNRYKFKDHVNYHRGTTPHKCQICNKIFTRSSGLKDHMNLHSGRKPYRCEICGKRYADISNWRKHKRAHATPVKTPFKCSICKEKFTFWKQIKNHTAVLHPENLKFLRISNKSKYKKPKGMTNNC